jgi:hypothetical protein
MAEVAEALKKGGIGGSPSPANDELKKLIEKEINPDNLKQLNESFSKFNSTVQGFASMANVAEVTNEFAGKTKEASGRLKGVASSLRRHASLIPATDEKSAESLAIIKAEADEIDALAQTAEFEDISYSSKRMTESYSRGTRSRKPRPTSQVDPSIDPDQTK